MTRGMAEEDFVGKIANEAINRTQEVKKTMSAENAILYERVTSVMDRVIDFEEMDSYEAAKYGLMYNNLAPDDIKHKISTKMVKDFLEETVKFQNPEAYEKIQKYYDFHSQISEKYRKKLEIFVENTWKQYRTVEYCYKYSISFKEFVDKYASKVDADGLSDIEKIKWLRLWIFIIKDQGFFWADIQDDGKIDVKKQQNFDRMAYLNPDTMMYLEPYVSKLSEKSLNVEMLKRFISLYPENFQKQVYTWAEMDNTTGNTNILRAGEIRMWIKRTLFPVTWMSPVSLFCMNDALKLNNPKYLESAVNAYKNGGIKSLKKIPNRGTDPFDDFKIKLFDGYELYSTVEDGVEKVLVVNCQNELNMFVEVYKWLLEHPDFKFGPEEKTLSEYGIETLLDEEPESDANCSLQMDLQDSEEDKKISESGTETSLNEEQKHIADWLFKMGLVDSKKDINWELFEKIVAWNEEVKSQYLEGEISAEEFYDALGFLTEAQAKVCCNKKMKINSSEATKMSAALKFVKMFGTVHAKKSDIIYLEIFKYMMFEMPEKLPKNMVNLYGKFFK